MMCTAACCTPSVLLAASCSTHTHNNATTVPTDGPSAGLAKAEVLLPERLQGRLGILDAAVLGLALELGVIWGQLPRAV